MNLYEASVPVFNAFLRRLASMLDHAEAAKLMPEADLLALRLSPDMFCLGVQVEIASNFAVRACVPLAGCDMPNFPAGQLSFDALRRRIAWATGVLNGLESKDFAGANERIITHDLWGSRVQLPAHRHLMELCLPSFFFHLSMVYALLRNAGVSLGKSDFDGFTPAMASIRSKGGQTSA